MALTYKGKAIVETAVGSMGAYAGVTNESIKAAQQWEEEIIKDDSGKDGTWVPRNEHVTLDVQIKLTGASIAAAKANATFLAPYQAVVLTAFDAAWMNVTWQYIGGSSIDLADVKHGGANIKLRLYADSTQQAAAVTTAT